MKKSKVFGDVFILSGFIVSFFYGLLNPLYVSVILSRLDGRILAVGVFVSSAFPLLIGAILGNRRLFARLYAALPLVMLVELLAAGASAVVAAWDVTAYYLVSMLVVGIFSTSVVYLMQKLKEVRYRRGRAGLDRRCAMADALGTLGGSLMSIAAVSWLRDPRAIASLGFLQTAIVFGLFILLYRKVPSRRRKRADEDPHPWVTMPAPEALPRTGFAGIQYA